jgi:predicted AAA+ superfamily ATPase
VQNLGAWDVQLKSLVDHATVRVLVTGSSALRIGLGRDSLAGRIQPFEVGPLRLGEIAALRGFGDLPPAQDDNGTAEWLRQEFWSDLGEHARRHAGVLDRAYAAFSERGAYPLAQVQSAVPWPEIADQLNETVIRRVIEHDLRLGERGRKRDQQLLEEAQQTLHRPHEDAPFPHRSPPWLFTSAA